MEDVTDFYCKTCETFKKESAKRAISLKMSMLLKAVYRFCVISVQ